MNDDHVEFGNPDHGYAIAETAGFTYNPDVDVVIMRVRDGLPMGGVVFTDYTGASIALHVAGWHPNWINQDMLFATFDYPFRQLGLKKIFGYVKAANEHALKFDLKLGFKVEAIVADVYPEGDMILVGMYRDECKYLRYTEAKGRIVKWGAGNGQEGQGTAAA